MATFYMGESRLDGSGFNVGEALEATNIEYARAEVKTLIAYMDRHFKSVEESIKYAEDNGILLFIVGWDATTKTLTTDSIL